MSVERPFEAWEEVQRQGKDLADRLAQGLIQSPFSWSNSSKSKLFDKSFGTRDFGLVTEDYAINGVSVIFDIGSRIGQAGADFGASLNGLVQQFYRSLPLPFKHEEEDAVVGSVLMGSERSGVGIIAMREDLGSLSERLKNHGFSEDDTAGTVVDEEGGGFNLGSIGHLGRRQLIKNGSDEELRDHFSSCGTITSAKVMCNNKGISKGFGFVCFSNPEEANKAVNTFHGFMFHGKPLYGALAQRKEDRQAHLQLQHAQQIAGLTGPSAVIIHGGYPPFYYVATSQVSNNTRDQRQNRGMINGHTISKENAPPSIYMPQTQKTSQSVPSSRESSTQQLTGQAKYEPSGRHEEMEKGSEFKPAASNSGGDCQGSEMLHSMLSAAPPKKQKQILGEHLYELVKKLMPHGLEAMVTGMLLEMNNAELLLLLESPE